MGEAVAGEAGASETGSARPTEQPAGGGCDAALRPFRASIMASSALGKSPSCWFAAPRPLSAFRSAFQGLRGEARGWTSGVRRRDTRRWIRGQRRGARRRTETGLGGVGVASGGAARGGRHLSRPCTPLRARRRAFSNSVLAVTLSRIFKWPLPLRSTRRSSSARGDSARATPPPPLLDAPLEESTRAAAEGDLAALACSRSCRQRWEGAKRRAQRSGADKGAASQEETSVSENKGVQRQGGRIIQSVQIDSTCAMAQRCPKAGPAGREANLFVHCKELIVEAFDLILAVPC